MRFFKKCIEGLVPPHHWSSFNQFLNVSPTYSISRKCFDPKKFCSSFFSIFENVLMQRIFVLTVFFSILRKLKSRIFLKSIYHIGFIGN